VRRLYKSFGVKGLIKYYILISFYGAILFFIKPSLHYLLIGYTQYLPFFVMATCFDPFYFIVFKSGTCKCDSESSRKKISECVA
jgi:hypothetical protein